MAEWFPPASAIQITFLRAGGLRPGCQHSLPPASSDGSRQQCWAAGQGPQPTPRVLFAVSPCTPQRRGADGAGQPLPKAGVVSAPELSLELSRDLCICRTETVQPSVRKCNNLIFQRFHPPF